MENILIVDNDSNLLEDYKNRLQIKYHPFTALDADEGMELLDEKGPFAVVMAELRASSPEGKDFLDDVKTFSPDSVRMILTAKTDMPAAVEALNKGKIFRFLIKPCPLELFAEVITAGIEQYRLVMAERELLAKTLHGTIRILCELLSLVNPQAFSRAMRLKHYVRHIAAQMDLTDLWQFEVAAMLSQIGCVTLPPDIVNKVHLQQKLTQREKEMFDSHPSVGNKLLANIPRLEIIAGIIEGQMRPFNDFPPLKNMTDKERTIALGAQMLKVALYFEQLGTREVIREAILNELCKKEEEFNPKILTVCANYKFDDAESTVNMVTVKNLEVGMVTDEDIVNIERTLLMPKGFEITYTALERLRNISQDEVGIKEPFRVRLASSDSWGS